MYGTTQMQLHTYECQTRKLNIVTHGWIVIIRESYFAFSGIQFFVCTLYLSGILASCTHEVPTHASTLHWYASALHMPVTTHGIFI